MTEKTIATIVIMLGGAAMIFGRRWNNNDSNAGIGIVIGVILVLFAIWG